MQDESGRPEQQGRGQEPDWEALARYIAAECDPDQATSVEEWLASHSADAAFAAAIRERLADVDSITPIAVDVEVALRSVQARLDAAAVTAAPALTISRGGASRIATDVRSMSPRRSRALWGGTVAAVAAAVAAAFAVQSWHDGRGGVTSAPRVVATAVGVRDSVTLSDGTRVVLAPGSKLTVAAGYGSTTRSVQLEGAAFFDVKHDVARPFTVRAADAEIRDVGTSFVVKTDGVGGVSVSVTEGIVALRKSSMESSGKAYELRAGDRGVVSLGTVAVTRGKVNDDDLAWTRGQLLFRDASLAEVQADLKRWYGVTLQVADSALMRLTVNVPSASNRAEAVNLVSMSIGADVEQHGDTVILRSAGRSPTP